MTTKINQTIGLLRKLQNLLPRTALITIYKAFVRPHLDYGDILYAWRRSGVFIVNFEHISHLVLVLLLLTVNR